MPSMSRDEFLDKYVLRLEKEFEHHGKVARWAPSWGGGPLKWGQEDRAMDLFAAESIDDHAPSDATMALSPDGNLLAVAVNQAIKVHSFQTKEVTVELSGHLDNVWRLSFATSDIAMSEGAKYLLYSHSQQLGRAEGQVVLWQLNEAGRLLNETAPFDVDGLSEKAISSISGDLKSQHGVTDSQVAELLNSFQAALKTADTKNRTKSATAVAGEFPYRGNFFNSAGTHLITVSPKAIDADGVRRRDEAQDLVIRPLSNPSLKVAQLEGHADFIHWASFSPTDPDILASASWDGSRRIWNTASGECLHTFAGEGKNQNWSLSFSGDGDQFLLAGTNDIGIYSTRSGERLFHLERAKDDVSFSAQVNAWSPTGDVVAFAKGSSVFLWEPTTGRCDEILKLERDEDILMESFKRNPHMRWLDEKGERLWVGLPGGSCAVWDRKRNWKWRMERPQAVALDLNTDGEVLYLEDKDLLVTLNDDGKIREWKLS